MLLGNNNNRSFGQWFWVSFCFYFYVSEIFFFFSSFSNRRLNIYCILKYYLKRNVSREVKKKKKIKATKIIINTRANEIWLEPLKRKKNMEQKKNKISLHFECCYNSILAARLDCFESPAPAYWFGCWKQQRESQRENFF